MTSEPSDSEKYWRNRTYAMKGINCLPRDFRFDDVNGSATTLTVDYAREAEVTSSLPDMLRDSCWRADNVGLDEIDGPHYNFITEYAEIFVAKLTFHEQRPSSSSSSIVAFILISPSVMARAMDSCLADVHVFRTADVSDRVWADLVRLGVDFASRLEAGYTDCIVSVSASCRHLIDGLLNMVDGGQRRRWFMAVATLPQSVDLSNGECGHLSDVLLLLCNLGIIDRPRRPEAEVLEMIARHNMADGPDDDAIFAKSVLPVVDFLPQLYTFRSSSVGDQDLLVNIRQLRHDEDRLIYDMIVTSARRGEGFDTSDVPTLAFIRKLLLLAGPCMILEHVSRRGASIVGWMTICPCWFARSVRAGYAEVTLVLAKEYQDRGLGGEINRVLTAIAKQLGYRRVVFDFFADNVRARQITVGSVEIGRIPRAGYLIGSGWQDLVINYCDVSDDSQPTFTQLVEQNRSRSRRGVATSSKL